MLRARRRLAAFPGRLQDVWAGLQQRNVSSAGTGGGGDSGSGGTGGGSKSSGGDPPSAPEHFAKAAADSFHKAPKETAVALVRQLNELDKIHLVLALQEVTKKASRHKEATQYIDDLVKAVQLPVNKQHSKLTRQQIERAVSYQRSLQKFSAVSEEEPSWRQLAAIGIASGLPFVVFGFLDNGIMLVAGEQIDAVFGARFGLTTLASAGLGNLVADVVGVSATHSVQDLLKRTGWVRPPPLSMLQQQHPQVKVAQLVGAAMGVAVGCMAGMAPLGFMEHGLFVDSASSAADLAANAAAELGDFSDAAALSGAGDAAEGAATMAGGGDAGGAAAGAAQAAEVAAGPTIPPAGFSPGVAEADVAAAAAAAATMAAAAVAAPEAATTAEAVMAAQVSAAHDAKPS